RWGRGGDLKAPTSPILFGYVAKRLSPANFGLLAPAAVVPTVVDFPHRLKIQEAATPTSKVASISNLASLASGAPKNSTALTPPTPTGTLQKRVCRNIRAIDMVDLAVA